MSKINTNVEFDYVNEQYKVTAFCTGADWSSTATVVITDPRGFESTSISISPNDNPILGYPRGSATSTFISSELGGYTYIDAYPNSVQFNDLATALKLSADPNVGVFSSAIQAIETGTFPFAVRLSKVDDVYSGVPLIISRGDSVPIFYVSGVSGKNNLTYGSTQAVALTGHNYANCIGQIVSGAHSGTQFHVGSYNLAGRTLVIDKDATTWSGEYFKLMPYRTVTAYSGWETYTGQAGGISARFSLDESRAVGVGSIITYGVHIGNTVYDVPGAIGLSPGLLTLPCTQAAIPNLNYLYDVAVGDTVSYTASGSLATTYATVMSLGAANSAAPGFSTLTYYPTGIIANAPNATVNIYRKNAFNLMLHPTFDTNYHVDVVYNGAIIESYNTTTPTAELELSANEFESTFGSVGDIVHFHIGPIHLSNGKVIPQSYRLRYNVNMYQGDVTSTTPTSTWTAHGTMGTDVGTVTNGSYMKRGMFTATYSQALNASETLMFDITAAQGGAKINKIVCIPVQPSA